MSFPDVSNALWPGGDFSFHRQPGGLRLIGKIDSACRALSKKI
jgi:hypothetical protein